MATDADERIAEIRERLRKFDASTEWHPVDEVGASDVRYLLDYIARIEARLVATEAVVTTALQVDYPDLHDENGDEWCPWCDLEGEDHAEWCRWVPFENAVYSYRHRMAEEKEAHRATAGDGEVEG